MAMSTEERVDSLENALKELAYAGRRTEMNLDLLREDTRLFHEEMRAFKDEMRAFKDEMRVFKDEMGEFKDEMRVFKDEMGEFKDEMGAFKDEMGAFKDEMRVFKDEMGGFKDEMLAFKDDMQDFKDEGRKQRREMNEKWGNLANKMGTFVEDMVFPSFPKLLYRYFGVREIDDLLVRRRKKHPTDRTRRKEFDIIAWTGDTVYLNETKSNPTVDSFREFVSDNETVYEFYPELRGKVLVKIASALSMRAEVLDFLTHHGCYAMMLGGEEMDLVNYQDITGRDVPPELEETPDIW